MQVLKAKDEALYAKLVRLAGGNTDIVMRVLSKPERDSVSLSQVVSEIETLRRQARAAEATLSPAVVPNP